jgi:hypothetical protein
MRRWPNRLVSLGLALAVGSLVAACGTNQKKQLPESTTPEEALAASTRVAACEWKAASQYDDGRYTVPEIAHQVVAVCAVDLNNARSAFGVSLHDSQADADEFKQAVETVENARKSRRTGKPNSN